MDDLGDLLQASQLLGARVLRSTRDEQPVIDLAALALLRPGFPHDGAECFVVVVDLAAKLYDLVGVVGGSAVNEAHGRFLSFLARASTTPQMCWAQPRAHAA